MAFLLVGKTLEIMMGWNPRCSFLLGVLLGSGMTGMGIVLVSAQDGDPLPPERIREIVHQQVQEVRREIRQDTLLLTDFVSECAQAFAEHHLETRQTVRDQALIAKFMTEYGLNPNAGYVVLNGRVRVKKGKRVLSETEVTEMIATKFVKKKNNVKKMKNPDFVYLGIGVALDERGSGVAYIIMGDPRLDNRGASKRLRKELPLRYTRGKRGLAPPPPPPSRRSRVKPEESPCYDVTKFRDWISLSQGLSIQGRYVYLQYPSLSDITPLIDQKKDGFAVEIVLNDQFQCEKPNVIDWSRYFRGKVLRPRYSRKIMATNESVGGGLKVPIGKLPRKFLKYQDALTYEMNLIVIQNKTFCKRVLPGYRDEVSFTVDPQFLFYPDTFYQEGDKRFKPIREKHVVEFKIYFEKGKYNYRFEDLRPILDTLNVPLFTIDSIYIEAHSSLEGDSAINAELQIKRAQSIAEALFSRFPHLQKIVRIRHDDSWEMFRQQIQKDPKWGWLADTTKTFVRSLLNRDAQLLKHLEPLLKEQRFALVKIYATIDIKGGAELAFFQKKMNEAVRKKDVKLALAIQRYLISWVIQGRYPPEVVLNLRVPDDPAFAQLHLNRWWMEYWASPEKNITREQCVELRRLEPYLKDNVAYQYNAMVCEVLFEPIQEDQIDATQETINTLKGTVIKAEDVDKLDLFYNIRVMDTLLSRYSPDNMIVEGRMEYLRGIFDPAKWDWQWGAKVAHQSFQTGNESWAVEILEYYLEQGASADLNFYRFYASLVSSHEKKVLSPYYRRALMRWYEEDPVSLCERLGKTYQGPSFQTVLDPFIKKIRCKLCQ